MGEDKGWMRGLTQHNEPSHFTWQLMSTPLKKMKMLVIPSDALPECHSSTNDFYFRFLFYLMYIHVLCA